jgi:hypothetical protein
MGLSKAGGGAHGALMGGVHRNRLSERFATELEFMMAGTVPCSFP